VRAHTTLDASQRRGTRFRVATHEHTLSWAEAAKYVGPVTHGPRPVETMDGVRVQVDLDPQPRPDGIGQCLAGRGVGPVVASAPSCSSADATGW